MQPQDLIKFGLIPEFVGRVPVVVGLSDLDERALVDIMTRPKNAIVKQYKKMFDMENVELDIKPEAIKAVSQKAMALKTGARGLRTIMEDIMLDVMFDIPTTKDVEKVIIDEEVILKETQPKVIRKTADDTDGNKAAVNE